MTPSATEQSPTAMAPSATEQPPTAMAPSATEQPPSDKNNGGRSDSREEGSVALTSDLPRPGDHLEEEVEIQLTRIRDIAGRVEALRNDITSFSGGAGSKRYIFLEETLMTHLLALDSTETFGLPRVRSERKRVTTVIQSLLAELESRATS